MITNGLFHIAVKKNNLEATKEFCEAALGSSARPLEHQTVLEKINHLSKSIAPDLDLAVVSLRQQIQNNPSFSLKKNAWINSFFTQ
jgi:hypothetical protein